VVVRWNLLLFYRKCCFLNGFWSVFVVMIFLLWSLAFVDWNYCFFVGSLVFLQLLILFGSLVVVRWNLLLFYRKCCFLNGPWCVFVVIFFGMESGVFQLELLFFFVWSLAFLQFLFFSVVWWVFVGICCFSTGSVAF